MEPYSRPLALQRKANAWPQSIFASHGWCRMRISMQALVTIVLQSLDDIVSHRLPSLQVGIITASVLTKQGVATPVAPCYCRCRACSSLEMRCTATGRAAGGTQAQQQRKKPGSEALHASPGVSSTPTCTTAHARGSSFHMLPVTSRGCSHMCSPKHYTEH
jgi:hypothetical protein